MCVFVCVCVCVCYSPEAHVQTLSNPQTHRDGITDGEALANLVTLDQADVGISFPELTSLQ